MKKHFLIKLTKKHLFAACCREPVLSASNVRSRVTCENCKRTKAYRDWELK